MQNIEVGDSLNIQWDFCDKFWLLYSDIVIIIG